MSILTGILAGFAMGIGTVLATVLILLLAEWFGLPLLAKAAGSSM